MNYIQCETNGQLKIEENIQQEVKEPEIIPVPESAF